MYSDNILGVCLITEVDRSFSTIEDTVAGLLGPAAISSEKRKSSTFNQERTITALGWVISLSRATISPSLRTLTKGVGYFFAIDLSLGSISIKDLQRLAAFGYYFCRIFPELRFLLGDLYFPLRGVNYCQNRLIQISLNPSFNTAVLLWRAAFCLYLSERGFERPLEDFRPPIRAIGVEFDGSPFGAGIRIFPIPFSSLTFPDISSTPLASASLPYSFGDAICHTSIFQNTCELLSLTLGLLLVSTLQDCSSPTLILLRGDSVTALEWASDSSFQIGASRATVMLLVEVCRRFKFILAKDYDLISSEDNWRSDSLSRLSYHSGGQSFPLGDNSHFPTPDNGNSLFSTLITLCDPRSQLTTVEQITSQWNSIRRNLN